MLIIPFRVLQGAGAAMTQANGMAMVTSAFSARERGKGLGAHGSVIGTGGIIGPIVGGFLVTYVSWHWIFWINVPLCAITFLGTALLLDSSRFTGTTQGDKSFDWLGAIYPLPHSLYSFSLYQMGLSWDGSLCLSLQVS